MKDYKLRLSNIELLRIVSMFCVLIVHADYGALGWPDQSELFSNTNYTIIRTIIESLAIVAVNVFVLISGWFGIKFKWNSLLKLLFQCAFFFFGIYCIGRIFGFIQIGTLKGIYMCLMMSENAWFIKSYLGMFILTPVLNAFIENSSQKQYKQLLILFYIFQSLYGWLSNGASFIVDGYSTFSFIGLYLLARYVRIYSPRWSQLNLRKDFIIYIVFSIITAIGILVFLYYDNPYLMIIFTKYNSLFIIGAALFLLLGFSKLSFYNKIINWVSSSSLAVYLFHFILFPQYMSPWIRSISNNYNGFTMVILICALLLLFFTVAIIIDKLRILLWNLLQVTYDRIKK